jgi:hypothetical protein
VEFDSANLIIEGMGLMQVSQAYSRRGSSDPHERVTRGNKTIEEMLKEYPQLTGLVRDLEAWPGWQPTGKSREYRGSAWSAQFFFDYVRNKPTRVTLKMYPNLRSVMVPDLEIDIQGKVPTLSEVHAYILRTVRRGY